MAEDLIVIGAGGFGRETLDVAEAINASSRQPVWRILGVVDDAPSEINLLRLKERSVHYLGRISDSLSDLRVKAALGIGNPLARRAVRGSMAASGALPATLIHPTAVLGSRTHVGAGTVICGGTIVGTNVHLGEQTHLNPHVVIGHDTRLGDFVSVNPNATVSGECTIGDGVLIGAGAVVLQGVAVGQRALIAASACVVRDVRPGTTVKGVPAS